MGEHRQALSIYVFNIGDVEKAEELVIDFNSIVSNTDNSIVTVIKRTLQHRILNNRSTTPRVRNQLLRTMDLLLFTTSFCLYIYHLRPLTSRNGVPP